MNILILTGAGLSAASGIPTYRNSENSLYNDNQIMSLMSVKSLHNSETKDKLKDYLFNFRMSSIESAKPNEAHQLIKSLCEHHFVYIITQNIDDLHEKSGIPEQSCFHVHGSLFKMREGEHSDIPDIVLFGEEPKFPSDLNLDNFDLILILGCSLVVNTIYEFLDNDIEKVLISKDVDEQLVNLVPNLTYINDDCNSGLKQFIKNRHLLNI